MMKASRIPSAKRDVQKRSQGSPRREMNRGKMEKRPSAQRREMHSSPQGGPAREPLEDQWEVQEENLEHHDQDVEQQERVV